PDFLPSSQIQTMQPTFGTQGVDLVAGDDGCGTRAVVHAEIIAVAGPISQLPFLDACRGVQAGHDFSTALTMDEHEAAAGNHRAAEPGTDGLLPDDRGAASWPRCQQIGLRGDAISSRSQELRPIRCESHPTQPPGQEKESNVSQPASD